MKKILTEEVSVDVPAPAPIVKCPVCGESLPLEQHPNSKQRLIAYCRCSGVRQAVYETDKEK